MDIRLLMAPDAKLMALCHQFLWNLNQWLTTELDEFWWKPGARVINALRTYFFWTLVLVSWQPSCSSLVMKLDFYKPTVLKVHPPIRWITALATMPGRLEHSIIFFWLHAIDPNEWKMVFTAGSGFEPRTFQSSALKSRPWPLAKITDIIYKFYARTNVRN